MKYTLLFLKCLVIALLGIIMLLGIAVGAVLVILGVLCAAAGGEPKSLVLIPVGLFAAFCDFVAMDAVNYCVNNWEFQT